MSGNVSEWTDSNYEKSANDFVAGINLILKVIIII